MADSVCHRRMSSIGLKGLVGLTGLGVSGFSLMHMATNLLIIFNPIAYNKYAHALAVNPFLYPMEAFLASLFLVHLILAIRLYVRNRNVRGGGYAVLPKNKGTTFAARTMIYSGLLLLVFLVLHLWTFKFGTWYTVTYDGVEMRDLHRLVVEKFQSVPYVAWYIVSLIVLMLHLSHGVVAALQSVGLASSLNRKLRCAGWAFALLVTLGFISQPLYVLFAMRQ